MPVSDGDDLRHPLLGDAPTLRLMPDPQSVVGFTHGPGAMGVSAGRRHGGGGGGDQAPNFVERLLGLAKLRQQVRGRTDGRTTRGGGEEATGREEESEQ